MNVVSLFSGCGGLDFGFEEAGFNICFRNDFDRYSCVTLKLNGKSNVIEAPIEDLSTQYVNNFSGSSRKSIDVIIGGPPCQPFSKSSYWVNGKAARLNDPRSNTLEHFFRFVEELKPRVFLLENVHGLNYNGKEEGFKYILKRISEINSRYDVNYVPSWKVLNVVEYGVPQLRVRFFLVAERSGKMFSFPKPTHSNVSIEQNPLFEAEKRLPYVTAWDAIGHLSDVESNNLGVGGKWGDLLPSIPEGENYLWHTERKGGLPLFGWRTRYWTFLLKLAKSLPSWTIQAQPGSAIGPFHWKNRKLTWREMAAIQTFPQDFVIEGPRVEIQRQIGNAVPSLMAEILARSIAAQFFGKKFNDKPRLSVTINEMIPDPEKVQSVPNKYYDLIGKHPAHPGTGKGISYQRQRL